MGEAPGPGRAAAGHGDGFVMARCSIEEGTNELSDKHGNNQGDGEAVWAL